MITKEQIITAHQLISPYIHKTPIFTSRSFNKLAAADVFFKCENFQKVGAFKARGAMHALLQLQAEKPEVTHVATHSSGNHAQALAWGAAQLGLHATIVMPNNAPAIKKNAVLGYGAKIIECQPTLQAREEALNEVVKNEGATFIHPYNDENIIAGAATSALEILEEIPEIENIITPVGGGGLLSGTALAAHYFGKNVTVFAGEPKMADDAFRSFYAKKLLPSVNPNTIADGLKTSLGEINFEIILNHVQDIFTVSETEIKDAMVWVLEHMKIVIEPSSAVAVATLLKNKSRFKNQKVAVILSGGNVAFGALDF